MSVTKLYKEIELIIAYSFKDKKNLRNSLIHPSSYKINKNRTTNNLYDLPEKVSFECSLNYNFNH